MKALVKLSRKPQAKVALEKLDGLVLDIGGGGEGTIAKTCGMETVSLDISAREIDEARSRGAFAHWVLCDACSMPLRNGAFDVATFFFSLMYIRKAERKLAVLGETRRVLEPQGALCLWDAIVPEEPDQFVVFVDAKLPNGKQIYTGYGAKGGQEKAQSLELVSKLALKAGFKVTKTESHEHWFKAYFR